MTDTITLNLYKQLPNELLIHIATYLDIASLLRLEQVSKEWKTLLLTADKRCWSHHIEDHYSGTGLNDETLQTICERKREACLDGQYWQDVRTWKELCKREYALQKNWRSDQPNVVTNITGYRPVRRQRTAHNPAPITYSKRTGDQLNVIEADPGSSYIWRARLDPAPDAQFIVTTWLSGGVRVIDARPEGKSAVLWELPRWSVRAYAHLEYRDGIACWDNENGIEVWKRWKLVQTDEELVGQDEPPNKRGTFVHVGTIPEIPGTRGFMLNEALHLSVVSSAGRSCTYNVAAATPTSITDFPIKENASWVYDFGIRRGATGHIEHDLENVVCCMGDHGYSIYHKESAKHLGDICFNQPGLLSALENCSMTNVMYADVGNSLPVSHEDSIFQKGYIRFYQSAEEAINRLHGNPAAQMNEPTELPELRLRVRRTNKPSIDRDEWGATMIRQLDDGATLLVARSMGGRFMFCTDLLGLLRVIEEGSQELLDTKVRECLAIIECGGTRCLTEFHSGGWLTVHGGRAAWEIEDRTYIIELPKKQNSIPTPRTHLMTMNSRYSGEIAMPNISVPASIMSLHDDCLISTYLHPAYLLLVDGLGQERWETSVLKSVRIVRFAPKALEALGKGDQNANQDESNSGRSRNVQLGRREMAIHQQWYITSRLMAGNAIEVGEEDGLWRELEVEEMEEEEEEDEQGEWESAEEDENEEDEIL